MNPCIAVYNVNINSFQWTKSGVNMKDHETFSILVLYVVVIPRQWNNLWLEDHETFAFIVYYVGITPCQQNSIFWEHERL